MSKMALAFVGLIALSGACSSSEPRQPSEETLREDVEEALEFYHKKDWAELYATTSPEYQAICSLNELVEALLVAEEVYGPSFFRDVVLTMSDVRVEGERASYAGTSELNGELISTNAVEMVWSPQDRRWYEVGAETGFCTESS